jgi:hypothetical protein
MDLMKLPLGEAAEMDISISKGSVVLAISVKAEQEVNALLDALKPKLPAMIQPLVDAAKMAIDAELEQA